MRIEYTGRHLEVPEAARKLAEQKLRKLARVLPGITDVHVMLRADRRSQVAELVVRSPHLDLAAKESGADLTKALKAAIDKLLHQAQHAKGRRRDKNRQAPPARPLPPAQPAEREPRVIKSRGFVAKPMTLDEALLQMETRRDGPLVFREPGAAGLRVLFWRRDGNLGLIEPEA